MTLPASSARRAAATDPATRRLGPAVQRVGDLAPGGKALDAEELDPLDVPDDGDPHGGSLPSADSARVAAVLLACLAAACFGALAVSIRIGLSRRAEPELAPLVISAGGFLLVAAVAALSGELGRSAAADLWPFVAIGAAVPGLSQLLFVRAIRDAGPSRAAVLIGTAPIISAILAVAFLGETLGPALGIATLLIVAGGTALAWEPARPASFKTIGAVTRSRVRRGVRRP